MNLILFAPSFQLIPSIREPLKTISRRINFTLKTPRWSCHQQNFISIYSKAMSRLS